MDRHGFRTYLEGRNAPPDSIEPALDLAERFEQFLQQSGGQMPESAWAFSRLLIAEGQNSEANFIALARYGLFTRSNPVFVAFLELLDGGEAQQNLYQRVAERFGEPLRDEVFAGIGVAPYGLPTAEKPATMHPVVERLEQAVGAEACRALLGESLRDLPDSLYASERETYLASKDVDEYLARRKEKFVAQLEACQQQGVLFFAQEITPEVLDYVRSEPEMGGGVRSGNVVYETKIPFMTREFLAETDPVMKRYHYCHCPWSREAIKNGGKVTPMFCNCSAGYHKKPWEAALGQKVQVEVLESVLQGDMRCRFAIHLPE